MDFQMGIPLRIFAPVRPDDIGNILIVLTLDTRTCTIHGSSITSRPTVKTAIHDARPVTRAGRIRPAHLRILQCPNKPSPLLTKTEP